MRRTFRLLLVALLLFTAPALVASISGCASRTTTTTTERVDRTDPDDPEVVERETTVDEETSHAPGGILSGTVDAIGWVLALPFRIVGGLISVIF